MSQADNTTLFRKVALERLSSPDRLDVMLGLDRPVWLLPLAGLAVAAAAALYWGLTGTVVQTVGGRCILTSPSGVAEVAATAAGRVVGLALKVGDEVKAGQEIARIVRPDLVEQIAQQRARLAQLERRREEIRRYGRLAGDLGRGARSDEQGMLEAQAKLAAERGAALERRLAVERDLFAQGLLTRQSLLAPEQALAGTALERERLQERAKQLALDVDEAARQRSRDLVASESQVNEARRGLEALLETERRTAPITTPYAGRVIEIKAHDGVTVNQGSAVVQIERSGGAGEPDSLEAVVYVAGGPGKLIAAGMAVEVVPDHVKRQEFGFLRGRVEQVSEYPASVLGMRLLVQNDNLLRELSGERSTMLVRARLARRADGGFEWSAAAARPPAVRSGALCQAEVAVAERRPISLVLPAIRRWLGLA
ncbi:MAG: NHLP bacteriocin system secretion protein [Betaproteobacteria bacterium]